MNVFTYISTHVYVFSEKDFTLEIHTVTAQQVAMTLSLLFFTQSLLLKIYYNQFFFQTDVMV